MDISKKTALIEALLLEDLPDCSEDSDVGVSHEEVEKDFQVPLSRGFDDYFEEAIERVLAEIPPSPTNEEVSSGCSVNQVYASLIPIPSPQIALPSTNTSMPRATRPKVVEPTKRKWKKRNLETNISEYNANTEVVEEFFAHFTKPTDIFQFNDRQ
ncbi:unnamed protein product [Parnassius apollo]|uniref:(apollo) hypothetical protein n=1 Tax=Parnassius apollo TaxID=110799 RepID=A0A8S3WDG6_PARAO|nr:unnamed protein product [Parnassius apollo]